MFLGSKGFTSFPSESVIGPRLSAVAFSVRCRGKPFFLPNTFNAVLFERLQDPLQYL